MTQKTFPCSVHPEWFDTGKSRAVKTVRKALRICQTCPVQPACLRAGRKGREFGVWGGETQPERFAALGITEDDALPQECGTPEAYSRHNSLGEPCEACEQAHAEREEAKKSAAARKRAEYEEIPGSRVNPFHAPLRPICGTERGYRAHLKRGELRLKPHPDCTCREARAALRAEQREEAKAS